ncbi:MAG TPA: DUF2905 domain-containing protein [Gemmatimonadaceae bacterium]|nr:DUF2905 domain-containing protein [Gemmatimonadaceae bacterium]
MGNKTVGQFVVAVGLILVVGGLLTMAGWLRWFGHLPGDIRIERDNLRVYVPVVSMLLLSVLFSVLSYVIRRIF